MSYKLKEIRYKILEYGGLNYLPIFVKITFNFEEIKKIYEKDIYQKNVKSRRKSSGIKKKNR